MSADRIDLFLCEGEILLSACVRLVNFGADLLYAEEILVGEH
jgi:hypothetical protein